LTESPSKNIITAQVYGQSIDGTICRIWTQIFDCKDGSFIVRYKVFNTCFNITIKIKIKEKELLVPCSEVKSMYIYFFIHIIYKIIKFKYFQKYFQQRNICLDPVYEEECYCPNPSITNWLYHYQCQQNYTQMHHDLFPFPIVDFDRIRESIIKKYNQPSSISICHYVLKSNKVNIILYHIIYIINIHS